MHCLGGAAKEKKKIKTEICNLWWMISYDQHTLMAIRTYGLVGELVANLVRFRDEPLWLSFFGGVIYLFFSLKTVNFMYESHYTKISTLYNCYVSPQDQVGYVSHY